MLFHSNLDKNQKYIDGGPGACTDGSTVSLPAMYLESGVYLDCESACDSIYGCIAFDVLKNQMCNLRFASNDDLNASPIPQNFRKWPHGCKNSCQSNYVGSGGVKGRCWIKARGNLVL